MNRPRHDCEAFETALSALLDGELERPEQLPVIDHLLVCRSCRTFYRRARALDEMVASAEPELEPAPEFLWRRIAAESALEKRRPSSHREPRRERRPRRRLPRWAPQLAALLAIALGVGLWSLLGQAPAPQGEVTITLEEDRGTMTDERFMEIAVELLKSDRRYHRQMLEVMTLVNAMAAEPEGPVDEGRGDDRPRVSLGDGDSERADSLVLAGDRL